MFSDTRVIKSCSFNLNLVLLSITRQHHLKSTNIHKHPFTKLAHATISPFHSKTDEKSILYDDDRTNAFGFPKPGIQSPTPSDAMAAHFFVDKATWNDIVARGEFDDVVVGSSFCALAYVDEAFKRDPFRKILILERGEFLFPTNLYNLPLPFKRVLGGPSETFPWTLSSKTHEIRELSFMHGIRPFFGGGSIFWSSWCPQPSADLMRQFPKSMKDTAANPSFWANCKKLLRVIPADQINDKIFGKLQNEIGVKLKCAICEKKIHMAEQAQPAPLAVGRITPTSVIAFDKFSTPGPLLAIYARQLALEKNGKGRRLRIATGCAVKKFQTNEQVATVLETSRGNLCFPRGKTNIILAAGAIPSTTILLNSLPSMQNRAGSRITGHFRTRIVARYPIDPNDVNLSCRKEDRLQIAASYVAGRDTESKLQYHLQITAIHSPNPEADAVDAGRESPGSTATAEQLKDSKKHVVLVCVALGEMDEHNNDSWVKFNSEDPDITTNVKVQLTLTDNDKKLWDIMEKATYDAISVIAGGSSANIEYWRNSAVLGDWEKEKPPQTDISTPGIIHEASTLYMGDSDKWEEVKPNSGSYPAVDSSYKPYGCKNVYVTGSALFPTAGSWNPTLTICGYTQDLAARIVKNRSWISKL